MSVRKYRRWTLEECIEDARNYQTRGEWAEKSTACYRTARRRGWGEQCCDHMGRKQRVSTFQPGKGVVFHKTHQRWTARITYRGKQCSLGMFPSPGDASEARRKAEERVSQGLHPRAEFGEAQ